MTLPSQSAGQRTTQYYACKHGIPGGCQACNVFERQERDEMARLLAENSKLKEQRDELVGALKIAAKHLYSAAQGIDQDHPMHSYFSASVTRVEAVLSKLKEAGS